MGAIITAVKFAYSTFKRANDVAFKFTYPSAYIITLQVALIRSDRLSQHEAVRIPYDETFLFAFDVANARTDDCLLFDSGPAERGYAHLFGGKLDQSTG
mmetsp:Transcript_9560/g.15968  ORF Transcript_9560/g.15968 Transcript_9560/m.15968 type:complete len:99 (+) Transcript_9560:424-720(+)